MSQPNKASGPLQGIRVVEMAGIGPAPFCGMVLADLGAEVIRVDRLPRRNSDNPTAVLDRGKASIAVNLKNPKAVAAVKAMASEADALIEGFRPGVMERLGLGPDELLQINPKLAYGRMTGWGQDGPLAHAAGHDINYIALTGALGAMGRAGEPPPPPLNLVGDFGGGGMLLAVGVLAAILSARQSGQGQVVDAAMTDGSALLMGLIYGMQSAGHWRAGQQINMLDGATHFYDTYRCADGKYISLGAIEPQFYAQLRQLAGLEEAKWDAQMNAAAWPALKQEIAAVVAGKTRQQWCELMEGTDVCFAPVLDMDEAPQHPHNSARQTFVPVIKDGEQVGWQPAPAPRFSLTPGGIDGTPPAAGRDGEQIAARFGFDLAELE